MWVTKYRDNKLNPFLLGRLRWVWGVDVFFFLRFKPKSGRGSSQSVKSGNSASEATWLVLLWWTSFRISWKHYMFFQQSSIVKGSYVDHHVHHLLFVLLSVTIQMHSFLFAEAAKMRFLQGIATFTIRWSKAYTNGMDWFPYSILVTYSSMNSLRGTIGPCLTSPPSPSWK